MEDKKRPIFDRTRRLVGDELMSRIALQRVIIFGVGGVGSWCAESLVRSGIHHLTIVDSDRIDITNVNRQCHALASTIGKPKVEVMKSRLLDINPEAEIEAIEDVYDAETRERYQLDSYDYIVDAIDSLACKADLILTATALPRHVRFFSSMGAALKMDSTLIRVDEFWNAKGCTLARALRQRFKRNKTFPTRKFKVVYSPEVLENRGELDSPADAVGSTRQSLQAEATDPHDWHASKVHVNGTMAHTTAIFGFTLAGLIMKDITQL